MPDELASTSISPGDFYRELDIQLLVHELKSPLALVEASTRTLLEQSARQGALTDRQQRTLQRILRGAVRGRRVVDHLLEIGRAEAARFAITTFSPAEAVLKVVLESVEAVDSELAGRLSEAGSRDETLAVLAQGGIGLRLTPGVEELKIAQDQVKFELVVSNLVQNALKFRRQALEIELTQTCDTVVVSVTDDGPGIAPEHQAAVFERYRQIPANDGLERKGHGLGLAGALIVARRLGGDIALESMPGRGATFRVVIPCGQRAEQAGTAPP
jgi:two-component system, OmpR family, sensor kinase